MSTPVAVIIESLERGQWNTTQYLLRQTLHGRREKTTNTMSPFHKSQDSQLFSASRTSRGGSHQRSAATLPRCTSEDHRVSTLRSSNSSELPLKMLNNHSLKQVLAFPSVSLHQTMERQCYVPQEIVQIQSNVQSGSARRRTLSCPYRRDETPLPTARPTLRANCGTALRADSDVHDFRPVEEDGSISSSSISCPRRRAITQHCG